MAHGKIPHTSGQLSPSPQLLGLCSRAWEPQPLKPECLESVPHKRSHCKERYWHCSEEYPALGNRRQLKKSNEDPAQPNINKSLKKMKERMGGLGKGAGQALTGSNWSRG